MNPNDNSIIVLSAGQGVRMGRKIPKMLIPLLGKPLLYWTLHNLNSFKFVGSLIVVVPPEYFNTLSKKISEWKFKKVKMVVRGGKERTDSTRNGLLALKKSYEWVGIHDGARPFAESLRVKECFESAKITGAAILAVPCTDTVKQVQNGTNGHSTKKIVIKKTLPRKMHWLAQTPQVFKRDIAEIIHQVSKKNFKSMKNVSQYTDDASIAESMGYRVRIVPSTYENIKVTTPQDLILAESILKKRKTKWR